MIPIKADAAFRGHSDCRNCAVRDMVLFADLQEEDFRHIHTPIDDLDYRAGSVLFHQGAQARYVYTIRRGLAKLSRLLPDGTERIVRVLRQGDVIGLEATASNVYENGAFSLLPLSVCRIPIEVIRQVSSNSPRLHDRLMQKWFSQVREADDWIAELAHGPARHRVARLILKLRDDLQPDRATLFARDEMAMMLGLTIETVSRTVASLTREQIIERLDRTGRRYRVDVNALEQITQTDDKDT